MAEPRVVIVGGGFGGLTAAKALKHAPVHVTLVDRTNHHLFQPLLYQIASAGLSPADIASPIRSILAKQSNLDVQLATVTRVDLAEEARDPRRRGARVRLPDPRRRRAHELLRAPRVGALRARAEVARRRDRGPAPDAPRLRARRADDRRERAAAAPDVRLDRRRRDGRRARGGVRGAAPVRAPKRLPRDPPARSARDPARSGAANLAGVLRVALGERGEAASPARGRGARRDAGDGDRRARSEPRRRADRRGDDRVGCRSGSLADRELARRPARQAGARLRRRRSVASGSSRSVRDR